MTIVAFASAGVVRRQGGGHCASPYCIGPGVLGSLIAFKYCDFAAGELKTEHANLLAESSVPRLGITAPAGYSFNAFSAASYLIDIYVGRFRAGSASATWRFTAYFPKILAGPIERATNFLPQLLSGLAPIHLLALGLQ